MWITFYVEFHVLFFFLSAFNAEIADTDPNKTLAVTCIGGIPPTPLPTPIPFPIPYPPDELLLLLLKELLPFILPDLEIPEQDLW